MSTLYLLQYNNYFNRTIKRESSVQDYLNISNRHRQVDNINFNYNDQVNTIQTVNYDKPIQEYDFDYLLVDNDSYGLSRWFIIENRWNRKGQQILTLRRDLVVDYFDDFINKDFFAEKGCINTYTSVTIPLISNSENILTSQILKSKTNIVPSTTGNAVVGYIDRSFEGGKVVADTNTIYVDTEDQIPFSKYLNSQVYVPATSAYKFTAMIQNSAQVGASSGVNTTITLTNTGASGHTEVAWSVSRQSRFYSNNLASVGADIIGGMNSSGLSQALYAKAYQTYNIEAYNQMEDMVGRHIMVGDVLYTLELKQVGSSPKTLMIPLDGFSGLIKTAMSESANIGDKWEVTSFSDSDAANWFTLTATCAVFTPYLKRDTTSTVITIGGLNTRRHCGQPYDIFYMADSATARLIASAIAARYYSSGVVYDIQLLPYKPSTTGSSTQTISYNNTSTTLYWLSTTDTTHTSTSFTKSYSSAIDGKVGALCDTCRIVSPNNANAWDFNPSQNGGVSSWSIRMTLKPFTPYIHIKPNFQWMYGHTWAEDPRGLICGGSFSFPFVTDKWAQYQLNNKAYYDAFNRDIDNLSTVQDAQKTLEKWQIGVGTLTGAVGGAGMGQYLSGGNPSATGIGAVAGGVASLVGGIIDWQMNEKLRAEAIDYRKDQFAFNCQNMIASPRTLARTDALDIDWNTYAYVEYYSASDVEKEAIRNKLKYNGWTLNYTVQPNNTELFSTGLKQLFNNAAIGQSNYIKGKLIWTEGYNDTHIFNELSNELYKGIYWEGGTIIT